jgi:hypothetical protein
VAEGYVRIKLKIKPGWDIEPVRLVRERFGDDLMLVSPDARSATDGSGWLRCIGATGL